MLTKRLIMKKSIRPFAAVAFLLASATAVIAAISGTGVSGFNSEFVQQLKDKFKQFYTTTAAERVYVQTDKTFYKPGETVWLTAYLRDEATFKPSEKSDIIHIELISPKGTTTKHFKLVANHGVANADIDLTGFTGGIYKLKAYTHWQKNDTSALLFEKELTIQNVVMPRLKMKLDFEKKAYGSSDEVVAKVELNKNDNKPLANTVIKYKAQLDGNSLTENKITTDAEGKASIKFKLPKDLNTIDATLNALIDFEGTTESIQRSIPIVLNRISMDFFPEGGDMVSNVNGKVAFRATNEFGKAADVEGIIVDDKGQFVTAFSSYHFGMGAFNLLPQKGTAYRARITKPVGILTEYNLPEALATGYTLSVLSSDKKSMQLQINSFKDEAVALVAQERGIIYYAKQLNVLKGNNTITLNTDDMPIGVTQLTLFDSKGIARCERLAFVSNGKKLNISVTTDKQQYQPREKVTMNIKVTDENGLPMPGNFSLSVVDDNLLSFADDKQGNILSKMLLEPELHEKVEEPNFYFDKKEEKSAQALDYLMLTAGWRHYTWKQINNNETPAIKYPAEQAVLSGVVYNAYENKPLAGAMLRFKNDKQTIFTDKDGKFEIRGHNLAINDQLEITAAGYNTETQNITNYGTNINYYLYDNRRRVYYDQAEEVDMVAVEAPQARALAREEKFAEGNIQQAVVTKKAKGAVDVEPAPFLKDLEQEPDVADNNDMINIADTTMVFANGKVTDDRALAYMWTDKNEDENQVAFYWAKEFPKRKYTATDTTRNDLASTIYWNGNIETDRSGKAKVEFVTNDLLSSFKTTIEGFGDDGSIGRAEYNYATTVPFSIDAKIPTQLISGDELQIPVFLKNTTNTPVSGSLMVQAPKQLTVSNATKTITVAANSTQVIYLNAVATNTIGEGELQLKFTGGELTDALTRTVNVAAKGFPTTIALSGQDMSKEFLINPVNVVPGSMKITFKAYPNVMSELMSGIDAILREPYGCFEQTSSSNYPNIMALQYLRNAKISDPKIEARATQLLTDGYKKLTAFETKENGYEWFGAAPAHEALTAYGLMEFKDMKGVYNGVDDAMVARTAKLLMDKRDGNGGFKKNPRALDSFGAADEDITNCYIVWALTEAGMGKDIAEELDAAYKTAKKSNDPYMLAMVANAMYNAGNTDKGNELVATLVNIQQEAGSWTGTKHSITRSTGEGLKIETTSLVALAIMKSPNPDVKALTTAIKFLVSSRGGYGGFGNTQSTILALKALTKYAEYSKKTDEAGTIQILVNGMPVASKDYAKGDNNDIVIDGLDKFVGQGKQKVEVRFSGCKNPLPYAMNIAYSTTLPVSSAQCVVSLKTTLNAKQAKVGETIRLTATLKNKTAQGQPMTMGIIGIPAGFSAQPWQLKELQEKGVIDFYETSGNSIACYYRSLAPNAQKQINLDLKAEVPGQYDAPASSAYLYYTNELKDWVGLDKATVVE